MRAFTKKKWLINISKKEIYGAKAINVFKILVKKLTLSDLISFRKLLINRLSLTSRLIGKQMLSVVGKAYLGIEKIFLSILEKILLMKLHKAYPLTINHFSKMSSS